LKFIHIRFKNFLSFGNGWTEFKLDTNETVLIFGGNGAGKSSLLESVFFAFTGKSYRNISKPKLINNLNKKNLVVELTIEHMESTYLIRRGMQPNLFEIIKDGELLDEDASIRDYQKQLESILGIDARTFKQTIMMSARHYTPFLDLRPSDKREFIENIFSLKLFSDMNDYLKRKLQTTKLNIKGLDKDIDHTLSNIKVLNDINTKQLKQNNKAKEDLLQEIAALEQETIDSHQAVLEKNITISTLNDKLARLQEKIKIKTQITKQIDLLEYKVSKHQEKIRFFEYNDTCKTCNQTIDDDFKAAAINDHEGFKQEKEQKLSELNLSLDKIIEINQRSMDLVSEITSITQEVLLLHSQVVSNNNQIKQKKNIINGIDNISVVNQEDFETLNQTLKKYKKEKFKLGKFKEYLGITVELISEKGIKKFIIGKYVPVLNTLLNQYLKRFEAPYSVMFNESLEENIIARGYDDLGYANLSSGEKQRLDSSLVFSFLELCRLKNSVNTNVIFFDEILDMSLDTSGINGILRIFEELKKSGYTVFVVSHRPGVEESFDKIIRVEKKKYSELEVM
jgi:DNA repair exonuclease SbcCD ATPase subunit